MNDLGPDPQSHFVESNGVRLHYLDWGTAGKAPIVLLHGIRLHARVWSDFCRDFRSDHHVMALDHRGHGDSGWPSDGVYRFDDYCDDLERMLDSRGLEQVTLLGHSLGARVAVQYTHRHPERVRRLVLVDMRTVFTAEARAQDFTRVTETPPPQDFASHEEAIEYLGGILRRAPRQHIVDSVTHGMRRLPSGRFTWKYDPRLGNRPLPRPGQPQWDLWGAMKSVRCPALMLHGEHSRVSSEQVLKELAANMPRARVERIDDAGHALFTDQPRAFSASVARFLAETDAE